MLKCHYFCVFRLKMSEMIKIATITTSVAAIAHVTDHIQTQMGRYYLQPQNPLV